MTAVAVQIKAIAHVLLVMDWPLPPLWELTITVSQEVSTLIMHQPITLMTHCGMDLIAILVLTVVLALPHNGFTDS